MPLRHLTPAEVRDRMASGDPQFVVLDVRQPEELALARVKGTVDIPMPDLLQRLGELDRTKAIAVLCHTGGRSQMVVEFLTRSGFANVFNVRGGIAAWARDVDPSVGTY